MDTKTPFAQCADDLQISDRRGLLRDNGMRGADYRGVNYAARRGRGAADNRRAAGGMRHAAAGGNYPDRSEPAHIQIIPHSTPEKQAKSSAQSSV